MIKKLHTLQKNKFIRNVVTVATGTAGAQIITMAFSPVITRIYGPDAYGTLGTFMAVSAVLMPIAALTYPIAIVLPKSDLAASGLAKLSARLAIAIAIIVSLIFLLIDDWFTKTLHLESIEGLLPLIPLIMVFSAFKDIISQWLIRKHQFRVTAKVAVLQALILNSTKIGAGLLNPIGLVLIVVTVLGEALHTILLWLSSRNGEAKIPKMTKGVLSIRSLAKEHNDFPLYRAPQVALNALSQSLPIMLLASFFGPTSAGFYTLGRSVLAAPSALIGSSVANVFYPKITEAVNNRENPYLLLLKATIGMSAVGILPFILIIAFGPWIFSLVFGSEWIVAGEYARWLSLWSYFAFLNRPSVAAIAALKLQGFFFIYETVSVIIRSFVLFIGFWIYKSDIVAVALFSISGAFLNSFLVLYTLSKAKGYLHE